MTNPNDAHPLAPAPNTPEEGPAETSNDSETVRVRGGVEVGAMRYVLGAGIVLGLIAMVVAFALAT
ncbi:MAG: hypothetical protein ACK4TG_04880 [Thermaurantiacus sp.]